MNTFIIYAMRLFVAALFTFVALLISSPFLIIGYVSDDTFTSGLGYGMSLFPLLLITLYGIHASLSARVSTPEKK